MKKLIGLLTIMMLTLNVFGQKMNDGAAGYYPGIWQNIKNGSKCFTIKPTDGIKKFIDNFYSNSYIGMRQAIYSFVDTTDRNNKKLYMLSYDTLVTFHYTDYDSNEKKEKRVTFKPFGLENEFSNFRSEYIFLKNCNWYAARDLYLWRWSNDKWSIVSDVVQTDVWKDNNSKISGEIYFPRMIDKKVNRNLSFLGQFGYDEDAYVKEDNGVFEIKLICAIMETEYFEFYYKIYKFTPKGDGMYNFALISKHIEE